MRCQYVNNALSRVGKPNKMLFTAVLVGKQISTSSNLLISGNSNPNYRIFDTDVPITSTGALADATRGNDMDANNWVGFWVATEHFDENTLQISVGKEDSIDPILVANLTEWGKKPPTHVGFSYGQESVKYTELRGEDASVEPESCSGEI